MGEITKIEWADSTFNPWIGCDEVGPACDHCYARDLAQRYGFAKWGIDEPRHRTSAAKWREPLRWNRDSADFFFANGRRRRVFGGSLCDWLDKRVPKVWRDDYLEMIEITHGLDWLLLSKRLPLFRKLAPSSWQSMLPRNVWIGATCENQERFDATWPILRAIPAAVRFISYEPACGPLRLDLCAPTDRPDWVIAGGGSGADHRPFPEDWALDIFRDCRRVGAAFLFKQWGRYANNPLTIAGESAEHIALADPIANGKGGALLDGRLHREFPVPRLTGSAGAFGA